MLRKCKVDVVASKGAFGYNEITKSREDFIMRLSDKIVALRKTNGWSQEELAEKLNVSRRERSALSFSNQKSNGSLEESDRRTVPI